MHVLTFDIVDKTLLCYKLWLLLNCGDETVVLRENSQKPFAATLSEHL